MTANIDKCVKVVTISASFGSGGSVVGPKVADRLGLPFIDRALPVTVSERLDLPLEDLLAHDERPPSVLERLFSGISGSFVVTGVAVPPEALISDHDYLQATQQVLREVVAAGGGVVLGRAGALVLARQPGVLHVRLDGDRAARIARAAVDMDGDTEAAARLLDQTDRDREGYVRYFYKADARDPSHYHLVLDATVIPLDVCADLIVAAACAGIAVPNDDTDS